MYRNDPEVNSFYVDSDMLELKERSFEIKYNDKTTFNFKLEKVEDKTNHQEFKVITLNIKRKYGKQMANIFTIVNEDVKFNDSSDLYLIKTINEILYKKMMSILKSSVIGLVDTLYRD
jgi:ribosomal protein S24E